MARDLDEVRTRFREARLELEKAGDELADTLTGDLLAHLHALEMPVALMKDMVREVPERTSLDYNCNRREILSALEEMERNLRALASKVAKLRRTDA